MHRQSFRAQLQIELTIFILQVPKALRGHLISQPVHVQWHLLWAQQSAGAKTNGMSF